MKSMILTFVTAAAFVACSGKEAVQPAAALPSSKSAVPAKQSSGQLIGTVMETQEAAGYTYVRLKTAGGEKWAAVAQTKVVTGQTVTIDVQMVASDFESTTLKRRFDAIAFGTIAGRGTAAPSPRSQPAAAAAQHMKTPDVANVTVPRAEGRDAKTVAELLGAKASLNGQPVTVRGTVVKFLPQIMGKNWIHLRDGSKSGGEDADITVTTADTAAVGDVVTVKGKVSIDKDFGSGYRYPVIIENAAISK